MWIWKRGVIDPMKMGNICLCLVSDLSSVIVGRHRLLELPLEAHTAPHILLRPTGILCPAFLCLPTSFTSSVIIFLAGSPSTLFGNVPLTKYWSNFGHLPLIPVSHTATINLRLISPFPSTRCAPTSCFPLSFFCFLFFLLYCVHTSKDCIALKLLSCTVQIIGPNVS